MDRNGYNPSLMDTEDGECFICPAEGRTARHEIFFGTDRDNSKKYGMWINVCPICHEKIHADSNGKYYYLKEAAQLKFEEEYSHMKFMDVFGRNYL